MVTYMLYQERSDKYELVTDIATILFVCLMLFYDVHSLSLFTISYVDTVQPNPKEDNT